MHDDLLQAEAAIDWAVAQIKVFQRKISDWEHRGPYLAVTEPDSQPGKELIKVKEREKIPLIINAEAGAIVHMIRSSLDILAVTLAERNGVIDPKDVYFPIMASALEFADPKDGAIKKIKRLSGADREAIEKLRPYKGGNDLLFALHQLDIKRKHRRLLAVTTDLRNLTLYRAGHGEAAEFLYRGGGLEDGTPLARVAAGVDYKPYLRLQIAFDETIIPGRKPAVTTLRQFAGAVQTIIELFDIP